MSSNEGLIKQLRDAGERAPLVGDTGTNLLLEAAYALDRMSREFDWIEKQSATLIASHSEMQRERDAAVAHATLLKESLDDLVFNSTGVVGLHKNGDIAPWRDLLQGGHLESWLEPFGETPKQSLGRFGARTITAAIEATRFELEAGQYKWICRVCDLEEIAAKLEEGVEG